MAGRESITHLFVYGTLRPGDVRWRLLSPFVLDDGTADSVAGAVFDTGFDYPAALFDGSGTVRGRTYALRPTTIAACLAALDHEENTVGGDYRRVMVTTGRGIVAWAYEYGSGLELTRIASGDWFRR